MIGPFQEADGAVSMRRIEAATFAIFSIVLAWVAFQYSANGWIVFIPSLAFGVFSILLLLFTTWADISAIISAVKGKA